MTPKKRVIFVLGGPGSGKGTVCDYLSREYKIAHLSAGVLLRKEMADSKSHLRELIAGHITNGTIVPASVTCELLRMAMEAEGDVDTFLLDGFPRNKENMDGWFKEMGQETELLFVLFLKASEEVLMRRCLLRKSHDRTDDDLAIVKKRLRTFYDETVPIISHFMSLQMVRALDTNNAKDEVFKKVRAIFDQSL
ncbi:UMP-CMP kinase 1 [Halyomorpha halys]|uniref:UMP-CMP kinase 1 n=1 Tax=Halyomorpha halys TaxID=286706 RepID=UPI0006D4DCE6|nr:UMP-CMP kinase 1-like [Halyomorpha halys]